MAKNAKVTSIKKQTKVIGEPLKMNSFRFSFGFGPTEGVEEYIQDIHVDFNRKRLNIMFSQIFAPYAGETDNPVLTSDRMIRRVNDLLSNKEKYSEASFENMNNARLTYFSADGRPVCEHEFKIKRVLKYPELCMNVCGANDVATANMSFKFKSWDTHGFELLPE